jgi:hypothetical protein
MDTNKMLRSMNFLNPISPDREKRVQDKFMSSQRIWQVTSNYIREKLRQKASLIDQQK